MDIVEEFLVLGRCVTWVKCTETHTETHTCMCANIRTFELFEGVLFEVRSV